MDQNVGYGLKIQGLSKEKIRNRVDHFLDLVGLLGYRKSFPHELSGGMQQRGSVVRATSPPSFISYILCLLAPFFLPPLG